MVKVINFLKRFVPAFVEVRSLYWVEKGREMDWELADIFHMIDTEQYARATIRILAFKRTWMHGRKLPNWLAEKSTAVTRAETMVGFLEQSEL